MARTAPRREQVTVAELLVRSAGPRDRFGSEDTLVLPRARHREKPQVLRSLARLRVICHEGEVAVEAGDTGRFVTVNTEFHAELARLAGNAVLAELAAIVGRRVRWYYRQVAPVRGHESCAEHRDMVEAIAAGDAERASSIARKHTERTRAAYHRPSA